MDEALHAGAARRTINPPLRTGKIGGPGQVTALHPDSEQRSLEGTLALIRELTAN